MLTTHKDGVRDRSSGSKLCVFAVPYVTLTLPGNIVFNQTIPVDTSKHHSGSLAPKWQV